MRITSRVTSVVLVAAALCVSWRGASAEDKRVDFATDRALKYLKRTQNPDGSWPAGLYKRSAGVASLAVLAFMAKGYTPRDGEYADVIRKGIDYVLSRADEKTGLIATKGFHPEGSMYSHGISTLMLSQAAGMARGDRETKIREVVRRAVLLILRAQKLRRFNPVEQGGWRHRPESRDSDISFTGWQLLSLRAAKNAGADVPLEAIDEAVGYIKRIASPGGGFGYTVKGPTTRGRAGIGMLCLEICAKHHTPEALRAADFLLEHPSKWPDEYFYYGVYYSAHGMYLVGGDYWKKYRPHLETLLLGLQNYDGSWPAPKNAERYAGGVYFTAMSVLALSVEYHYLPIYER